VSQSKMNCAVCGSPMGLTDNRLRALLDGVRADFHWWCLMELVGDEPIGLIEAAIARIGRVSPSADATFQAVRGEKTRQPPQSDGRGRQQRQRRDRGLLRIAPLSRQIPQ
jgi:hypothetical protein